MDKNEAKERMRALIAAEAGTALLYRLAAADAAETIDENSDLEVSAMRELIEEIEHPITTKEEHDRLLRSERELRALEAAGVDNWAWYSDAMRMLGSDK